MAGIIRPGDPLPPTYRGLPELFEFTNWDGRHTRFNCGQAAACTLLAHHGILPASADVMPAVERQYPPDNLVGYLGTSRRRVERICRGYDLKLEPTEGEEELRRTLEQGRPIVLLLEVPGPYLLRWQIPVGHWMVAYGFDSEYVYLSNWGRMPWEQFRRGWHSFVPRLTQMAGRGLAVRATCA